MVAICREYKHEYESTKALEPKKDKAPTNTNTNSKKSVRGLGNSNAKGDGPVDAVRIIPRKYY